MDTPYTIILDLSRPNHFQHWRAPDSDISSILARFVQALESLCVREARVVCGHIPSVVRDGLARSPKVSFHQADEKGPAIGVARAAAGIDGEVVLLTAGNIWLEQIVDQLVAEHRKQGRRTSVCNFHAGFAPIITSAAVLTDLHPSTWNILHSFLHRLDKSAGIVQVRRQIPAMNIYARPDLPDGWRALAWMSAQDSPREDWNPPRSMREGFITNRENYRSAFRAIESFQRLDGARVLEIGCSPINETGPSVLIEEFGVREYTGINLDPIVFPWTHPRAKFHVGDASEAPFGSQQFDIVFSIAVWEHVQNPRRLFHRISDWLARGGGHYGRFQVWSSSHGYHLPPGGFPTGLQPPFCHLLMSPEELRADMLSRIDDEALVDRGIERIYRDPYINRVGAAEFLDIIRSCGLEIVYLDGRSGGRLRNDAIRAAAQLGGEYSKEELSIEGFEFYLRKSDFRLLDVRCPDDVGEAERNIRSPETVQSIISGSSSMSPS